jgi:hypothetical protein
MVKCAFVEAISTFPNFVSPVFARSHVRNLNLNEYILTHTFDYNDFLPLNELHA